MEIKIPPNHKKKNQFGGNKVENLIAKIQKLSDIQQEISFTEFDFYHRYEESFKSSELGRIKSLLPLREMAISFGLVEENPKSFRMQRGRKPFFTPEGKVALAFLKMYTGLSAPKLMEALNGNIHYQIFCGIRICPESQLTNYKLIDNILLEQSKKLKIQEQQKNHFNSGDSRESIPNRIVSVSKPSIRPIVRGKECKTVEFGGKCNNIIIDGISFIEKLSFNAFYEGARLKHSTFIGKETYR